MRGKGKKEKQPENKASLMQFPKLALIDYHLRCPTYSQILSQDLDEDLVIENESQFVALREELEDLLVAAMNRRDEVLEEIKKLSPAETKTEPSAAKKRQTIRKKGGKNTKKTDELSTQSSLASNKNSQGKVQDLAKASQVNPKNQRSDTPTRFWEWLKIYSADITQDHIKFLEEWAKPVDENADYFKIPPRGKHYSYEWSNQDVQEDQKEGAKANDKRKALESNSSLNSADTEVILKKARMDNNAEKACPFGPLTQRLVSCLIETNIMTPLEDAIDDAIDMQEDEPEPDNKNIIQTLNIGNPEELEKRIRKGLEVAGILEPEPNVEEDPKDEVLAELQKVQAALKATMKHNWHLKLKLLGLAKEETLKQELKKKLHVIDCDLLSMQKKMEELKKKKLKRSNMQTKTLQELLNNRDILVKKLEAFEK